MRGECARMVQQKQTLRYINSATYIYIFPIKGGPSTMFCNLEFRIKLYELLYV